MDLFAFLNEWSNEEITQGNIEKAKRIRCVAIKYFIKAVNDL